MRVRADARALPLAPSCVDVVISNPPYPGSSPWGGNWWAVLGAAVSECQRVLRARGRGWFLVRNPQGAEQWLTFDKETCCWAHAGAAELPKMAGPGITWGTVPEADVVPLILGHSPPDGVVLDPFAGRGGIPKLVARLGRVPVGMDIDADQLTRGGRY